MRIIRAYPFLPPVAGGMEKHVQRLTQEQRLLGCDVTILFNSGCPTSSADRQVLSGWNLRKIKLQVLRDAIFYLAAIIKVSGTGTRTDVLHIHGDWSAFFLGRVLGWATGAQFMMASVHGAVRTGRWSTVYRHALRGYAVVYCTGAKDAKALQSAGVTIARHQNSGIDEEFFLRELASDRYKSVDVVCVANFLPVKNLALVVQIAKLMPELGFMLIGEGPQRQVLEDSVKCDGLRNVQFAGPLPTPEIARRLRTSRIFLITSLSEGTPTALLEAMACGLPIVTSHSNDYEDVLKLGFNGYVVEDFDAKKYVDVIGKLLSDQPLCDKISAYSKIEAKRHSWIEVAKRITNWVRNL